MNIENVPTSLSAIYPPRQSTTASASDEARLIVEANSPRRRAARSSRRITPPNGIANTRKAMPKRSAMHHRGVTLS